MTHTRARTVAHMQRLVATATAASAASCTTPEVKTVTITPLPVPSSSDTDNLPTPPPPPTASATLTAPVPPVPPPDPSGYLVVDMLPAPARCLGVASSARTAARFHRDGARIVLDLVLTLSTQTPVATFTGTAPTTWSATVVSSSFRSHDTVAAARILPGVTPSGQAASFGVMFAVSCGRAGNGTLAVNVSYTAPAVDGAMPTVTLHDY